MLILENERRIFFPPVDNDFSIPSGKEQEGGSFEAALKTCPSKEPMEVQQAPVRHVWGRQDFGLCSLCQGDAVEPKAFCLTLLFPLAAQKWCI